MNCLSLFPRNLAFGVATLGALLLPWHSHAQTISPTPIEVVLISTNDTTAPALNNTGEFTAVLYNTPTHPLPAALPPGNYPTWCGTRANDSFGNNTYTVTTTPPATITPSALSQQQVWNEINYALNNKGTLGIADVQAVIWGLVNGLCAPTSTTCTSASYLQSRVPAAYPLYNAAVTNGANFSPAPGQTSMALLITPTTGAQHIIIERVAGGAIGDRVWWDADNNGIQDTTPLQNPLPSAIMQSFGYYFDGTNAYSYQFKEQGLNGIKVDLYSVDAFGHPGSTPIASTQTANSPANYPYMPAGTAGWYQFTGLAAGNYQVRVDITQTAITSKGLVPTKYYQTTTDLDSNDPVNGANTTINNTFTPPTDETLDFGFTGAAPLQVTCAASTGRVGQPYSSTVAATGGIMPYTYSVIGGSLPNGLTLHSDTGVIDGTPTLDGTFNFTVQVKDASGLAAGTITSSCGITIAKSLTLACANGASQVGVYYSSAVMAADGVAPYTYSALDPLPDGLTLNASTGVISGTPTTAGLFSFRVRAVDSSGTSGNTVTNRCAINVVPPNITPKCVNNLTNVGATYLSYLTATGGTGTGYTFAIASGDASLPPGLRLNAANSTIYGSPTAAGTYSFTIQVTDSQGNTGTTLCTIVVQAQLTVVCASGTGFVGNYNSAVNVTGGSGQFTYSISAGSLPTGLGIDAGTGAISGMATTPGTYSFTVQVADKVTGATATASCTIIIYPQPTVICSVSATTAGAQIVAALKASGGAGNYTYSLASGTPAWISVDSKTGVLSGLASQATGSAPIVVTGMVTDSTGGSASTTSAACNIVINQPPSMTCAAGVSAGTVGASFTPPAPAVTGGTPAYTFSVAPGSTLPAGLTLNPATGAITGTPQAAGTFSIQATDSRGITTSQSCPYTVAPAPVMTCAAATGAVGTVGIPFNSPAPTVSGGVAPLTFSVAPGSTLPGGLFLNTSTGAITGTPASAGSFTLQVTDGNGVTATGGCAYTVVARPVMTCSANASSGMVGYQFNAPAPTITGGYGAYTFSVIGTLPAGLKLNANGSVSGAPLAAGSVSIQAADSLGNVAAGACPIAIVPAPTTACGVITNAVVGLPITPVTLTGSGGLGGPYTFTATGLPQGLTMSAGGTISGTPLVSGSFSYTVQVMDAKGNIGTINCSVLVAGGNMCGLTWGYWKNHNWPAWPAANGLTVGGQTYSAAEIKAIFATPVAGDASLDLAHQLFAAWLNVYNGTDIRTDTNNAISNADALLKTYNKKIPLGVPSSDPNGALMTTYASQLDYFNQDGKAQPGCGNTPTTLTLACAAPTGIVGVPYSSAVVASGGMGAPYTYAITSGALPGGLTFNPSTGAITGTPATPGTFNFTVTAYDSSYTSGTTGAVSSNCSITVTPAPTATCVTINATQGVAITPVAMTASGGAGGPYTFSATGLAAGLTMSSTGTISGTPTASGTFNYTVTITDQSGNTGTVNCSVTVNPPATPVTATCVTINAIQGAAITPVTMSASGGAGGPYTFSATGLPAGLTMSSTGAISGTPAVTGTFSYTVTVTDNSGKTGTVNCSVTVNPPISVTCVAISAIAGVAITPVTMTASGGFPTYTFTAAGLPAGLTMSTSGAISGTPTTGGSYVYTVTVRDSKGNAASAACSVTVGISSNMCGLTWGYWKNHVSAWPVTSLALGSQTYSQTELQTILGTSVAGDASLDLAHQLIAAKFNVLHGTNPATDGGAIAAADSILDNYSGKLPYNVASSSTAGAQMTSIASQLDYFNQDGKAQPGCGSGPTALVVQCAAGTGTVGVVYNSTMTATGGMGAPYTFTIVSGALPDGLTLDPNTGAITGTPAKDGIFTFSVQVADSSNNAGSTAGTTTTNCTIVIAPSIICPTATAKVNENYASPIVVNASAGNYTLSLASGTLPPGLTLDTVNNALKGTPTTAGTYSFTLRATDPSTGISVATNCTIVVNPATLSLICPAGTAQTTIAYSSSVNVTGGSAPYTFSLISGSLPPGLIPNATTGQLSGVPTATGTYSFTVGVVDSAKNAASASCTIVVTTPTGTISAGMFTTYTQGGWGASPKGNNPGMVLSKNFTAVYSAPGVVIGGTYKLTFGAATNIDAFLPQGSTAGLLKGNYTNPSTSTGGVLAGQTLALQLSVDFSNKGLTPGGLSSLHVVSGKMAGYTVGQVLGIANQVLGGTTSALPSGMSITDMVTVLDSINQNFDNGTSNKGYLKY